MVGYRVSLIALLLLCVINSPMSFGKSVTLKTITVNQPTDYGTIYGQIHFDERDLAVALKVEKIIKTDLIKVVNYFHYVPQNTVHFNVDPYMRLTNGNARTFPTNIINLYNFPASNGEHLIVFDDWLRGLVFHEYTHITHLDQTRGFVEVGRRIFGNIAKLFPSDVPRWFTEGIAVWSESHLMGADGRLQNPLFRKELLVQFLRQDYCASVDCLDEPGVYPNGSLSYWAGSHFIEYIENRKPGAVRCLVEANSSKFPFFLNEVFKECTGNTAQNNFDSFRSDLISAQPKVASENETWGLKIGNVFGSDDPSKGVVVDGNILVKVESDRRREALVSYDLEDNVNMAVTKFHYPISDLVGTTTMTGADGEPNKYLIASFNEDPYFRADNRVWKLINLETLLLEYTLPFKNDPSYVVGLGNNRYLTASFIENKWRIEKQRIDLTTNNAADVELVHQFDSNINITFFKKAGQKLFVRVFEEGKTNTLLVSDLSVENFYKLYSSKNYFEIPTLNEKSLTLKEKEKVSLFEFNDELKTFSANKVTTKFEAVSFAPMPVVNADSVAMESFPKINHMRPYYWFLSAGTTDNLFSFGAMTTFSDPMDINTINATVLSYPSVSKVGGNVNFYHKFSSISDLWSVYGVFNQEYAETDFLSTLNETTEGTVGTQYTFLLKRWALIPGLYVGTSKTSDFISERTTDQVGTSLTAAYNAMHFDDYFQNLTFVVRVQKDLPDIGESFVNLKSLLSAEGRFHQRLVGGFKTSYAKLYKDGFTQGVIYAGGTNGVGVTRWHEFYGLPYNNAYGNEIFTLRLYLDYNLWYAYQGFGFFPLYLKEVHLLAGHDTLSADRIILDKKTLRDETIHSFFAGPRFKLNMLYYMPVDVDFIFSSIKNPNGNNVNQYEVSVNADLF